MTAFQQTMFIIACAATLVLIVQILLMLIGGSNDADVTGGGLTDVSDADIDIGGGVTDGDFSDSGVSSMLDGSVDGDSLDSGNDTVGGGHTSFGLRLLSVRSIIAFLAIGGWMGYTLCYVLDWYYALIIALACGFAAA